MERLAVFALILCVSSIAIAEITTTVYLADEKTPLDLADPNVPFIYRDIMVGAKLAIVVSSNAAEKWSGALQMADADRDYGAISARDHNDVTHDWEGSHLEAAGIRAGVDRSAGSLRTSFSLSTDRAPVPGDWFVIDYIATNVGNCVVSLYHSPTIHCSDCDPFNPPPGVSIFLHDLVFSHVPTRDFNGDAKVDFVDFAILNSFRTVTNCADLNWCEGADLDTDGDVDRGDLMLFADYWLESTE